MTTSDDAANRSLERFIWKAGKLEPLPSSYANEWYFRLSADGGVVPQKGKAAGEAAIGVVLKNPDGSPLHEISARIGLVQDHHVAEYRALISGLGLATGHGIEHLHVFLDSRLVVSQVNGTSATNKQHLRQSWMETVAMLRHFREVEIQWVPRKENAEAHACASQALRDLRNMAGRG